MRLVKCTNTEIILSVTTAAEIGAMIDVAMAMSKPYGSGITVCPEGVSFKRKGVKGFSLYLYNDNGHHGSHLAKADYMAAKEAVG